MTLRVWKCNSHAIQGKLENLVEKAAKIKEESRFLSVTMDLIEYDEKHVETPAFSNLIQAFCPIASALYTTCENWSYPPGCKYREVCPES